MIWTETASSEDSHSDLETRSTGRNGPPTPTASPGYTPDAPGAEQLRFIETLHQRLTQAKIPERLQRIPEARPDLLGVILKEGKV